MGTTGKHELPESMEGRWLILDFTMTRYDHRDDAHMS